MVAHDARPGGGMGERECVGEGEGERGKGCKNGYAAVVPLLDNYPATSFAIR